MLPGEGLQPLSRLRRDLGIEFDDDPTLIGVDHQAVVGVNRAPIGGARIWRRRRRSGRADHDQGAHRAANKRGPSRRRTPHPSISPS